MAKQTRPAEPLSDTSHFWRPVPPCSFELRYSRFHDRGFPEHWHDTYSIGLVEQGAGLFYHRRASRAVAARQVVLIMPADVHRCTPAPGTAWSYRMLHLRPDWMRRFLGRIFETTAAEPVFNHPVSTSPLVFRELHELCRVLTDGSSRLAGESALCRAMAALVRHCGATGLPEQPAADEPRAVRTVVELLHDEVHRNVSLGELAELAGLSPYHLLRVFRKATGLPPHAYQTQLRLNTARRLLATDMEIADIALRLGFTDQSHFTRKFSRYVGTTPRHYRRAAIIFAPAEPQ